MHADLVALLELQERDRTVQQLYEELAAFDPQLAELDAALAACRDSVDAARQSVVSSGERRTELEGKIENFREMQERRRQRLEWVRGAKEAATLMAELDLGRSVLAKEEAEWVRSADHVQAAEAQAAEAERALEELDATQRPQRDEIATQQDATRARIAEAERDRSAGTKAVPAPLLASYERIRKGRAPLALYPLHADACGHCYTAVPLHRKQELLNGRGLVACEGCGVLVYLPEPTVEA